MIISENRYSTLDRYGNRGSKLVLSESEFTRFVATATALDRKGDGPETNLLDLDYDPCELPAAVAGVQAPAGVGIAACEAERSSGPK